ncbi:hypothetical protein DXG03_001782 [Asterophora parasitica]|uniref:Bromo domain-containing protein n=1 Tax=Asterophora parasitica TaxID=117018 RepID=A0A9P7KBE6_9AGAR|nr:hypothetical protein DXG03_001782 [Asterophora parasitica]
MIRSPSGDSEDPVASDVIDYGSQAGNGGGNGYGGNGNGGFGTSNGAPKKRFKKTKGWAGEVADANLEQADIPFIHLDDPAFTTQRKFDTEQTPDGGAMTHVAVRCTLADIARATHLRVEDAAFALNEIGLLMRRFVDEEEGDGEGETVVISRALVERVAKERNVKKPSSPPKAGNSKSSGLTLVLPALRGGKPIKSGKKSKQSLGSYGSQDEEKKMPRPLKLKPLKEVLTKLIAQIKKKDDYAFFLKPVDTSQIQGYTDVVKRPMDLGTMSVKVDRGKYRSLEDFASDLRLVTSNAKAFNPPGTIYYTEAERIEAWGMDHISKAAATVIQFETDWNIEIENDDDTPVNVDDEEDYTVGTPMDVDEPAVAGRSPSVSSQNHPTNRRSVRGPYKKMVPPSAANTLSESIDAEGRLPGSRDGLGAFPPGSAWAQTMLALKLKGKRYKTKKERLRIEREGPPLRADGTLDYTEMEDPFSVLSNLTPEPFARPSVIAFQPLFTTAAQYDSSLSQSQSQPPHPSAPFPTSINVPFDHPPPDLPIYPELPPGRRRHWAIVRNPTRTKGKDRDDEAEPAETPAWQTPRDTHATDYGSFAVLAGVLEEEIRRRKVLGREGEEESKVCEVLRDTMHCDASSASLAEPTTGMRTNDYWTTQRASTAENYIRDVVYGGLDGLAYVRSLAEFVSSDHDLRKSTGPVTLLTTWVERHVIDSLTEGRHSLLREAAVELARQVSTPVPPSQLGSVGRPLFTQVRTSLHLHPSATVALSALLQIKTHKIDMGSLIKTPDELFQSEEEWAGKVFRERREKYGKGVVKGEESTSYDVGLETEEPERTWMDVDASSKGVAGQDTNYELEGPEELKEVLEYAANAIVALDRKIKEDRGFTSTTLGGVDAKVSVSDAGGLGMKVKTEAGGKSAREDPVLRNLRLNLLALAKRAPLDTIAHLPKELVPEHIQHFVPTLGA